MHFKAADATTYRREGARAFAQCQPILLCPYLHSGKRHSFYALDPAREWRNGWIDAKDRSVFDHDEPSDR